MKTLYTFLGLLAILSCFNTEAKPQQKVEVKSFTGYQVIRAVASTQEQGMALVELQGQDVTLDFWTEPSIQDNTDFMAPKDKIPFLTKYLKEHNIPYHILIEDVGAVIGSQTAMSPMQGIQETMSWTKYHTLDTIYEWYQNLTEAYNFVDVLSIGNSSENRDLKVIRLSLNPALRRPAIFIDATIHAREWVSLASVTYMINELVSNPADRALLNEVDFYFLPVINPDGYEFTGTTNRMWRKTRSANGGGCFGADANRNFDYEWGSCSGCSSGVCTSETFRGTIPFSEPEAEAMRRFIENSRASVNFQSYISVHSYGQYFMIPWGFTSSPPVDYAELKLVSDYVAGNITAMYGTQYRTGSSSTTIYPTDGTSQDWAYGSGIFKYVFTAELRDTGRFGFLLPAEQIIPTAQETWAGFKVVARHIMGK